MAIGAGIMAGSSLIGGLMARKSSKEAMAMQADFVNRAMAELEKVGIPSIEAQKIALETPELVFQYAPMLEQEFPEVKTAMADIQADPRLKEQQSTALAGLEERSEMGMTPEERAELNKIRRESAGAEQASQGAILAGMGRRGALDSGAQLAQQLAASQSAAQGSSEAGDRLAAMEFSAKQDAIAKLLAGSTNVRAQEFSEDATKASAEDRMRELNALQTAATQSRNIGAMNEAELAKQNLKQQLEGQRVQTANAEQQYNKSLQQQKYENEMRKAETAAGMLGGAAQMAGTAGENKASNQMAMMQGLGQAGAGAASYFANKPAAATPGKP